MPILEQLLSRGYIDGKYEIEYSNIQLVNCPLCQREYKLEDGVYKCKYCNKLFRKFGLTTYDAKKVSSATVDYLIHLLTYLIKCEGEITLTKRDYILEYIKSFDMNEDQLSWSYAQYDYARYNEYSKDTIILLKKSIIQLDNNNLELEFLFDLLSVILVGSRNISNNQLEIIEDFLDVFHIPTKDYERVFRDVKNSFYKEEKKSTQDNSKHDNLNQYYEILGLKKGCSESDLKKRYAYLTKSYHPDKYSSQDMPQEVKKEFEDMYKKINFAYDKLKDII